MRDKKRLYEVMECSLVIYEKSIIMTMDQSQILSLFPNAQGLLSE